LPTDAEGLRRAYAEGLDHGSALLKDLVKSDRT
jgi:hypothetical protein